MAIGRIQRLNVKAIYRPRARMPPQLSGAQAEQSYRSRPPMQEKAGSRGDANVHEATGRDVTGARWFLICAALYLANLLYGLDITIAADIQGAAVDAFSDASQLAWIGAGFPLGSVAVILPYGFLFTSFDIKAGGTGIYLGGLNYISGLTTREEWGTYLSGTGFVWGVGAILGPIVGGGFAVSPATWRWGFWINLVIGAVTAPIMLLYLPSTYRSEGRSTGNRLANLDFVDFVLSVGVWVAFAMGLISVGGVWPWDDGTTIKTLVVFGVLLFAATSCAITGLFTTTYYVPICFQFVQNDTTLMAALRLLPSLLVTVSVNLASGWALSRIKYYMPFFLASGILLLVAGSLFHRHHGRRHLPDAGAGYTVATLKAEPADAISATNQQSLSQLGSTVICLAVGNLRQVLAGRSLSEAELRDAVSGVHSAVFETLSGDIRGSAVAAISTAMQKSFVLVIVAGALETLSALGMKFERLVGEIVTM
ncbi:hypothetical protein DL764_006194 [Monosporascus ibericus]|uniref:Major facilitator superfamily (MFS) profile domain-containing protein n=1 Tax=Monosporascus ibericus TaxID=155417 RepID=A0A4Q4T5H1_9PEZI|nr:hypothetical protein DL764_006194 [Monosporascus ibericus]